MSLGKKHIFLQGSIPPFTSRELSGWLPDGISIGGQRIEADATMSLADFAAKTEAEIAADYTNHVNTSFPGLKELLEDIPNNNKTVYLMTDIESDSHPTDPIGRDSGFYARSDADKKTWVDGHRRRHKVVREESWAIATAAGATAQDLTRIKVGMYVPSLGYDNYDADTSTDINNAPFNPPAHGGYATMIQLTGETYGLFSGGDAVETLDFICPQIYIREGPTESDYYLDVEQTILRTPVFTRKVCEVCKLIAGDVSRLHSQELEIYPLLAGFISGGGAHDRESYFSFDSELEDTARSQLAVLKEMNVDGVGFWNAGTYPSNSFVLHDDDPTSEYSLTFPEWFALLENVPTPNLNLQNIANDEPPCFVSFNSANNNLYLIIPNKDINPPIPPSYNPGPGSFTPPTATEPVWEGSSRAEKEARMFDTILVAEDSILTVNHSGGANHVASYGDYILVVYASSYCPHCGGTNIGTYQYLVIVSRSQKKVINRVNLGLSETILNADTPVPDNHDQPAIAIDSNGVAHVIITGHHTNNWHTMSTSSDYSTWSTLEQFGLDVTVGSEGGYTYTSMVIDSQDRLHVVHRAAKTSYHFNLAYNRRNADGTWEYPTSELVLVEAGHAFYSIWYHRLRLGNDDKLYLNFQPLFSQLSEAEVGYYNTLWPGELPSWWHPYQTTAWSNADNAKESNDTYATCVLTAGSISRELQATNFGFSAESIPGGEAIEGILFEVERDSTVTGVLDYSSWALKAGTPVGDQLFSGSWPTSETTDSSGGASDLHGTTWTIDDIEHVNFGFRLSGDADGLASTLSIDHMQITVYTDGGTYGPRSPGTMASVASGIASGQKAHGPVLIMSSDGGDTWATADQGDI